MTPIARRDGEVGEFERYVWAVEIVATSPLRTYGDEMECQSPLGYVLSLSGGIEIYLDA